MTIKWDLCAHHFEKKPIFMPSKQMLALRAGTMDMVTLMTLKGLSAYLEDNQLSTARIFRIKFWKPYASHTHNIDNFEIIGI